MKPTRRSFLIGAGATLIAAPAIVHSFNIMLVRQHAIYSTRYQGPAYRIRLGTHEIDIFNEDQAREFISGYASLQPYLVTWYDQTGSGRNARLENIG